MVNKLRGTLNVCAVKAPGFGDRRKEMLKDIGVISGGQVVTEDLGIELANLTLKDLGRAKTITIDKSNTTIIDGGGKKDDIQARVKQIRAQIEESTPPGWSSRPSGSLGCYLGRIPIPDSQLSTATLFLALPSRRA